MRKKKKDGGQEHPHLGSQKRENPQGRLRKHKKKTNRVQTPRSQVDRINQGKKKKTQFVTRWML